MAGAVLRKPAVALLAALLLSPAMLAVLKAEHGEMMKGMADVDGFIAIGPPTSISSALPSTGGRLTTAITANASGSILHPQSGNELSGKEIKEHIHADRYAKDVISLKKIVDHIYRGHSVMPLIIAPAGNFDGEWYCELIVKANASSSLDVVTIHTYGLGSGLDEHLVEKILDPSYLNGVASKFRCLRAILLSTDISATGWVGEAGGAYHGGRHLVTNTFISSFWYLDQLALSAKYDTKAYCRQSLIGGTYGLLNTTTFKLNPDYYRKV